ncbi:MAG: right-handed parallel beta-helix repeat-containing protein, partial [Bacteroidota bacterium]|nr:right-handed parallel beta-helix repeat-containing protein [Bacteroidota bacterium]
MRKILLISLIALMGSINVMAQATLTHTTDEDFKKGYLNNMMVTGGSIEMPPQATSMNSWASTTNLPDSLKDLKVCSWKGFVFLTGGQNSGASSAVYRATLNTNGTISSWTTLNSLPVGICNHEMVIANGYIYVLGGKHSGSLSGTIYYAKILSDNSIGNWQTHSTALPQAIQNFTADFINGYLLIAGGTTSLSGGALSTVYSSNVGPMGELSAFASQGNSLPGARSEHTMVSNGKYIYVLGGHDNSNIAQNTVYYSELSTTGTCSAWLSATNLPMPVSSHSSTCQNGLITVLGGYNNVGTSASTDVSYFAEVDNSGIFSWDSTAFNQSYAYYWSNAGAIATQSHIYSFGGRDIFGNIKNNVYSNSLNTSTDKVQTGNFVSSVFDLFGDRQLIELSHIGSGLANYGIYYRTAVQGAQWGNWTNTGTADTVPLSLTKRHIQYMFSVENASTGNSIALESVSLAYNTTQISGTLNGPLHWTLANSPYVVVGDITLASDTLIIDPGVEILFYTGFGFTIDEATLICNGTQTDSIKFAYFGEEAGLWDGLYFNTNSDNGVSSTMQYTIIEKAGAGSWDANLYCNGTDQPTISHCAFRDALGQGIRLNNADISIDDTKITGNTDKGISSSSSEFTLSNSEIKNATFGLHLNSGSNAIISNCQISGHTDNGIYLNGSSPAISNTTVQNNENEGVYFTSSSSPAMDSCQIINNTGYGIYCTSSHPDISNTNIQNNGSDGVYFSSSTPQLMACTIQDNTGHGIYATSSSFTILNSTILNNDTSGVYLSGGTPELSNCDISGNSGYGVQVHNSSPDFINVDVLNNTNHGFYMTGLNSSPQYYNFNMVGNLTNDFRISAGDMTSNSTWSYGGYNYIVEGTIYIVQYNNDARLTIEKGNTIKFAPGVKMQIGDYGNYIHGVPGNYKSFGGELYAIGTSDSLITFTSLDSTSTWYGMYFHDKSDS